MFHTEDSMLSFTLNSEASHGVLEWFLLWPITEGKQSGEPIKTRVHADIAKRG